MPGKLVIGPTFRDLQRINFNSPRLIVATAFYSRSGLNAIEGAPRHFDLYCRLDLSDPSDWIAGSIAPDALLDKINDFNGSGLSINVFVHPSAHAKFYVGQGRLFVGSANLTLRAFSGGPEVLYEITQREEIARFVRGAKRYFALFRPLDKQQLGEFVRKYRSAVSRLRRQRKIRASEDVIASAVRDNVSKLGNYSDFLNCLDKQGGDAAWLILARGSGRDIRRDGKNYPHNNLSGHVRRSFYGIRQYFLRFPGELDRLIRKDPSQYHVFKDDRLKVNLPTFIKNHAVDEADFTVTGWQTYVPRELGGNAGKRGGAIGSLNRMFPLVARYLRQQGY